MENLIKTQHFIERSWERGYHQSDINILINKMEAKSKKHFFFINKKVLSNLGIKKIKTEYLVIITKDNVLITLFEIDSLYQFLKQNQNISFTPIN